MGRDPTTTDRLAAALKRKNAEAVIRVLAQQLETARLTRLDRSLKQAETEAVIMAEAAERHPEFADRGHRAAAVARGELKQAKLVAEHARGMARPDPKGLLITGEIRPGRAGLARATLVFANADGAVIENTPEIEIPEDGRLSHLLGARDLTRLQRALGDTGAAFVALRIGQRVLSTTARPFRIRTGGILQVFLAGP